MQNQPVASQTEGSVLSQTEGSATVPLAGPIQAKTPPPASPTPTQTQFTPPSPNRKIIIFLIVLVLAAVIAGSLFYLSRRPKPAAQVGREKITIEAVASFSRDCDNAQNEAAEYLVDNIVLEKWAQDEKIAFSKEDKKAEEIRISGKEAALNCIAVQAKVNLLREKLAEASPEATLTNIRQKYGARIDI